MFPKSTKNGIPAFKWATLFEAEKNSVFSIDDFGLMAMEPLSLSPLRVWRYGYRLGYAYVVWGGIRTCDFGLLGDGRPDSRVIRWWFHNWSSQYWGFFAVHKIYLSVLEINVVDILVYKLCAENGIYL